MVYLYKIPTIRIAAFCLISFLGVYLVNTVCLTNDAIISLAEVHEVNHHHGESTSSESQHGHGHDSSEKDDNCCSGPSFQYYSLVQGLIPHFELEKVASYFISSILHIHSIPTYLKDVAVSLVENNSNGPPTLSTSGMSVRILIQSFII
jgi:hypothetical protein